MQIFIFIFGSFKWKDNTGSSVKIDKKENRLEAEWQTKHIIKVLGLQFTTKKGTTTLQNTVMKIETTLGNFRRNLMKRIVYCKCWKTPEAKCEIVKQSEIYQQQAQQQEKEKGVIDEAHTSGNHAVTAPRVGAVWRVLSHARKEKLSA